MKNFFTANKLALVFTIGALSLGAPFSAYSEVYKWVDENGKVVYSDTKPESAEQEHELTEYQDNSDKSERQLRKERAQSQDEARRLGQRTNRETEARIAKQRCIESAKMTSVDKLSAAELRKARKQCENAYKPERTLEEKIAEERRAIEEIRRREQQE